MGRLLITLLANHALAHTLPSPPENSLTRFVSEIFLMDFPGSENPSSNQCCTVSEPKRIKDSK